MGRFRAFCWALVIFLSLGCAVDRIGRPATGVDVGMNAETFAVQDLEKLRFNHKMPETIRRRADALPVTERERFIGLWGRTDHGAGPAL